MKTYQKPTLMIVKFVHHPLLNNNPSGNTGEGGGSRELRSVWKDDEE